MKLLGDGTRLRILALLKEEELSVGELAAVLEQRQSTISTQLGRLKEAGFVQDRKEGTRSYYRIAESAIETSGWKIWELSYERLQKDPRLAADRERLARTLAARREGTWLDRAAGSLDRRWVPGRSWSTLALGLGRLLDLGVCVDMGSGDGALLPFLAPASQRLLCLDSHRGMVERGRERAREGSWRNVEFLEGDMQSPPFEDLEADTVLWFQSLQYAEDPRAAIRAGCSLLRLGGRAVVLTLERHEDRRMLEEYGHMHPGFGRRSLKRWLEGAGMTGVTVERLGHEPKAPHLSLLLALGVKS